MKYKCVIFDCDGVLVDSEAIQAQVLVDMTDRLGLNLTTEFIIGQFLGKSFNEIKSYISQRCKHQFPSNFESEYRRRTYEAFDMELKPIPGIHFVLQNLKVPFGVASSGPIEKIRRNLRTAKLLDKFGGSIFSCYEIQKWKPSPDIYLHAAKSMGFAPHECAVVEDSAAGVQAALGGGFDVFLYSNNTLKNNLNMERVVMFDDMTKLIALLEASKLK